MIRPITCVTFLLACGSGLYLYQAKHKVHVLDGQIEQVIRQTSQIREQTRVLHATWTLLDQPDRLQQLASQFLTLQPTKPTQFASAADLDSRLPPVTVPQPDQPAAPPADEAPPLVASAPAKAAPAVVAAASTAAPATVSIRREPSKVAALPPPIAAPVRVTEHPAVHVPEHVAERTPEPARPARLAAFVPPRPASPRVVTAALPRPTPTYQHPAYPRPSYERPAAYQPPAYQRPNYQPAPVGPRSAPSQPAPVTQAGGSMLGMARSAAPPPPAPMWVNWNSR